MNDGNDENWHCTFLQTFRLKLKRGAIGWWCFRHWTDCSLICDPLTQSQCQNVLLNWLNKTYLFLLNFSGVFFFSLRPLLAPGLVHFLPEVFAQLNIGPTAESVSYGADIYIRCVEWKLWYLNLIQFQRKGLKMFSCFSLWYTPIIKSERPKTSQSINCDCS